MLETPENTAIKNNNKKTRKLAINSRAQVVTKDLFGTCIGISDSENIEVNMYTRGAKFLLYQMDDSCVSNQKTESFCKVCGDKASGKHYGVASCDGCRGFFKRSIRRNLEYVCKENGNCIVDVTRRNQCQACRFKKCLQVNMKRDGISNSPYTMQKQQSNMANPTSSPRSPRSIIKDDEVSSSEEIAQNKSSEEESIHEESSSRLELPIDPCRPTSVIRHLEVPYLNLFPAENVYESAAKLLFLAIKWARTIPSFLQLSYRDQSILLEESWNELFVLTAAQWAFPVDEESRGLCEPTHVELLQDQTHVMLHEYCSQKQNIHKGRFGKLLLTLPAVQSVSRRGLEELLFRQTVGDVAIDRLLGDLAKAAG
ncbi:unnamed protein product [Diabrotica balteata]|uniref:Uncharacterized protein n=1 Tax=Diabrotica balteata TaxID=107213 RepID=A0A9N9T568_DIABA|nr:unnamed protein product [Diabrotica balteata]